MDESAFYDRNKLYEEVWAEAVDKVAKRYGVSGVALAKTCRKLTVPLPTVRSEYFDRSACTMTVFIQAMVSRGPYLVLLGIDPRAGRLSLRA